MPLVPVLSLVSTSLLQGALAFALVRFAELKPFPWLSFLSFFICAGCPLERLLSAHSGKAPIC